MIKTLLIDLAFDNGDPVISLGELSKTLRGILDKYNLNLVESMRLIDTIYIIEKLKEKLD